jgi:ABC-type phosphate/phosphonate transport system substrate-binding protein
MRHTARTLLVALLAVPAACGSSDSPSAEPVTSAPRIEVAGDRNAVKVGVLAIRSAVAANAQYGPIVESLQDRLGRPFELVPVGQDDLFDRVANDELDFVLSNPMSSVQVQRLHGTEFLATLDRPETGDRFGGLIIVRADSDIEQLEDLRGRHVTCVAFETAAGGCNFQVMHLREVGVTADQFATFTETPSQDNIVLAVLNGDVDAGFIRTGQLERMVNEGTLLSVDELKVIDRRDGDYVHPHTTQLYPEWPFAAVAGTDPQLVDDVAAALLTIGQDDAVGSSTLGFVPPMDYSPLHELVVELELRSWDATG